MEQLNIEDIKVMEDVSYDELQNEIIAAWEDGQHSQESIPQIGGAYVSKVYKDYIITHLSGKMYKVAYSKKGEDIKFGEPEEVEMKIEYVKADMPFDYVALIELEEDGSPTQWIQMHEEGEWEHPEYGTLAMTKSKINAMIKNFNDKLLGYEPSGNLHHDKSPAQGWVKELAYKNKKLMGKVEWTKEGIANIRDKLYRYISPEYKEDHDGKGALFVGFALTNKPFLPGQKPLVCSMDVQTQLFESRLATKKELQMLEKSTVVEDPKITTPDPVIPVVPVVTLSAEDIAVLKMEAAKVKVLEEQLIKMESDAKKAEIVVMCDKATSRGVDPFTINSVSAMLVALQRNGEAIVMLEEGAAPVNMYRALSQFLQNVTGPIKTEEQTQIDNEKPNLNLGDEADYTPEDVDSFMKV